MNKVELFGKQYSLNQNETVLDGLLRHQVAIAHGCKAGACHSCLMQCIHGRLPADAQFGLNDSQIAQGYFLACCCIPDQDLIVKTVDLSSVKSSARIIDLTPLTQSTTRMRLLPVFEYQTGQYLNILLDDASSRSYSICSVSDADTFIELHIKRLPQGRFSKYTLDKLIEGESITVQGPFGSFVYSSTDKDQPLLMIGMGTGLGAVYGIARNALLHGHSGPIHIIGGAKYHTNLYLTDELNQLEDTHTNVTTELVAQYNSDNTIDDKSDIYSFTSDRFPSTKGYQIYLCGPESFVEKMKSVCLLSGTLEKDIHVDVFLPCS